MDQFLPVLDAAVLAVGAMLAAMTLYTAARYRELRFALVGLAIGLVGVAGGLGLLSAVEGGSVPWADLGWAPSLVLLAAEALLYVSFVATRSPTTLSETATRGGEPNPRTDP
ncbi:MAG: hypothetical protein KGI89_16305 [Euryarchaeota archaeon]|nr:hypothetical protein [Euryarchaeota archaeon]